MSPRLRAWILGGFAPSSTSVTAVQSLEVGDTRGGEVAEAEFLRFTEGAAVLVAASERADHITGGASELALTPAPHKPPPESPDFRRGSR